MAQSLSDLEYDLSEDISLDRITARDLAGLYGRAQACDRAVVAAYDSVHSYAYEHRNQPFVFGGIRCQGEKMTYDEINHMCLCSINLDAGLDSFDSTVLTLLDGDLDDAATQEALKDRLVTAHDDVEWLLGELPDFSEYNRDADAFIFNYILFLESVYDRSADWLD